MILIIADESHHDVTPGRVLTHLQKAGADAILVDSDTFRSGRANFSLSWSGGRPLSGSITLDGRTVAFSDLRSVWFWRLWFGQPWPETPESKLRPDVSEFFHVQWRRLQYGLGLYLSHSGVFCVNPMPEAAVLEEKVWQLELARSLGFTVPDTLLTSDLSAARTFFDIHEGDIVYKTLALPLIRKPGDAGKPDRFATIFTTRVKREDLADEKRFLPSPSLFQQRVDKQVEVRATVVGNHVFAATIDAQASARARLDWRRYDGEGTQYGLHTLPADIETKLIALVRGLGLAYGAADFIVTPEGEYVFLELNPNGQFLWVETLTGLPITANLAAMLMAGGAEYERKG